jgi:tetratricopeptide (TPR) repeat protein
MKCLEKEPSRRYASAGLLADELKRYLDGRPILARPLSVPERAFRWSRRNPLPASLIGVTFVAIMVAMAALGVSNVRTEAARKKSEESFHEAMSAVNDFFTRVSEERLLNEPGLQDVRHDLLKKARDYYEKFLKQRGDDPSLKNELAATQFRMGLILEELETPEAALDWFAKARETQQAQVAAQAQPAVKGQEAALPDSLERTRALSNTINAMGRASAKLAHLDDAADHFREAERLREGLIAQTKNADDKFELIRLHANCRMNLGVVERQRHNLDEAARCYAAAQTQRETTLPQKPKDRAMRRDLAKGFHNLANLAIDRGDVAGLRDNIGKAIELLEKLVQENARDLDDQYLLSLCYRLRGDQFADLIPTDPQAFPAAQDDYSNALRVVQRLSDLNPSVQKYLRELAGLHVNLGQLDAQRNLRDEAIAHFRKAHAILKGLLQQADAVPDPAAEALRKTVADALQHFGIDP